MKKIIFSMMVALGLSGISCDTMGPNARAGTGIGAVTGGIAGAAIANNTGNGRRDNNRVAKGAILGAGVGALGGAAIGDSVDRRNGTKPGRYQQGYYQQGYNQQGYYR